MSERNLWYQLRDGMTKNPDFFLLRVENQIVPGTPDIFWAHESGASGWLELKYTARWPIRGNLTIKSITQVQRYMWRNLEVRYRVPCLVLTKIGRAEYLLLDGTIASSCLGRSDRDTLIARADHHQVGRLDHRALLTALIR